MAQPSMLTPNFELATRYYLCNIGYVILVLSLNDIERDFRNAKVRFIIDTFRDHKMSYFYFSINSYSSFLYNVVFSGSICKLLVVP